MKKPSFKKTIYPQYSIDNTPKLNYTIEHTYFLDHDLKTEHNSTNYFVSNSKPHLLRSLKIYLLSLTYVEKTCSIACSCRPPYPQKCFPRNLSLARSFALIFEDCNIPLLFYGEQL